MSLSLVSPRALSLSIPLVLWMYLIFAASRHFALLIFYIYYVRLHLAAHRQQRQRRILVRSLASRLQLVALLACSISLLCLARKILIAGYYLR